MTKKQESYINLAKKFTASNYNPLPVVLTQGCGIWVWDVCGQEYMDMLSVYSALNFGHLHPQLVIALRTQLRKMAVVSRAFHTDNLGLFCQTVAEFCGMEKVLPMNTGAEAVETAVKIARKWGYEKKKVEPDQANIIVCANNFHGRTITVISFSTEPQYQNGFGPLTPGFRTVEFGNADDLLQKIDKNTVAFLVEPIQGEGGVVVPPDRYLTNVREICATNNVLMIADEIQTGFGRTGYDLACQAENVKPDMVILGKALGGGLLPVSAVVTTTEIMDVIKPGDHGSTFGGNPLACAVAIEAIKLLKEKKLSARALSLGEYFHGQLQEACGGNLWVEEIRGRGLMLGIKIKDTCLKKFVSARDFCLRLIKKGILCYYAHNVVRFSPPLIINKKEIDWAAEKIKKVFC